jgi:hypothetical protein
MTDKEYCVLWAHMRMSAEQMLQDVRHAIRDDNRKSLLTLRHNNVKLNPEGHSEKTVLR